MARLFIGEDLWKGAYHLNHAPRQLDIRSPQLNGGITSFGITIEPVGDDEKNPNYKITIDTNNANVIICDVSSEYIIVYQHSDEPMVQSKLSVLKGMDQDFFGITRYPYTFVDNGDTFVVLNDHLPPKKIVDANNKSYYTNNDTKLHPIDVGSVYILNGFDRFMLCEVTHIAPGVSTFEMTIEEPYSEGVRQVGKIVSDEFLSLYYTDKISYEKFLKSRYMTIENICIVVDACSEYSRVWTNLGVGSGETAAIHKICDTVVHQARSNGFNKHQLAELTKDTLKKELDKLNFSRLEFVVFLFANDVVSVPIE